METMEAVTDALGVWASPAHQRAMALLRSQATWLGIKIGMPANRSHQLAMVLVRSQVVHWVLSGDRKPELQVAQVVVVAQVPLRTYCEERAGFGQVVTCHMSGPAVMSKICLHAV